MPASPRKRLIVAISGASGNVYGLRALEILKGIDIETHLVMSKAAERTLAHETTLTLADAHARADVVHAADDIGASIASGSFRTEGMLVAPCSIHTLSEIAHSTSSNLLTRAADVMLKERRRLVLMVRETPLHLGHLRAMTAATEAGAIIMPPVPAFYAKPETLDDMVTQTVVRALDLFGIDSGLARRWGETPQD
ncbi:UbiX family flavin prenyltransferase [Martelella endophytica]|uniref:Flavin prenyltransferase UbiX n=1 Tax=Martelella endophytica TaxID=1486262 RepID=A0A0D5LNZ2_MAREN|nr:UbiX family flavin prenyltransferase [Martelella endophytica]AJY45482.1 hypothetical protein TM49_06885 [Martelella endophytica]